MNNLKKWDAADYLQSPEEMSLYLDACIAEDTGDGLMIRLAMADIAKAKNMNDLAKQVGVSREGLYKALSEKGNPSFALMLKLSRALGLKLHLTSAHN